MNRELVRMVCLTTLFLGGGLLVKSQPPPVRANLTLSATVIQVIASPTGGNIRPGGAGHGSLDLGHLAWAQPAAGSGLNHKKAPDSFSISTNVGLRLDCPVSAASRSGIVTATLQQSDPRYFVFLDSAQITLAPSIVNAMMPCGTTTEHLFEIRVPVTAAAGPIYPNVLFQVTLR